MDLQTKLSKFYKMVLVEAEHKNTNEFIDDYNKINSELKKYFDNAGINFLRESGRDITDTPFKLTSISQVSNCPGTTILLIKN